MERRTLIAVALSFLVLYAYQAYFVPRPAPTGSSTTQQQSPAGQQPSATPSQEASKAPEATSPPASGNSNPSTPAPTAVVSETAERDIVVETATIRAVLSNRGARVRSWQLKTYLDDAGHPVDLVPRGVPAAQPSPFTLQVDDADLTRRINDALYRVNGDTNGRVDATSNRATVTFEFEDASGLRVRKEFRFDPANYVVSFGANVAQGDRTLNPTVLWGPGLGDIGAESGGGSFFTGNYVQPPQAIADVDGDVARLTPDDLGDQPVQEGQFRFVGIDDHYFLAAAVNPPGQARAEFRPLTLGTSDEPRIYVTQALRFAQPPQNVQFFFGPKQYDALREIDIELVKSIYFGIFAWLAIPLLNGLKWIYGYVGNYGWAIIILTILINLAMFPLRHKAAVSMRKMQALQPAMKAIQDRYKDLKMTDPAKQKMNTEVMNLYREKGVNPASGCVPMLLTMPVLFAFYSLLSQAIELRGAPFIGWITDLSQHDRYFVTPLLMGASMFWQAKITPTTADPAQQRMMLLMPIIFTGMFLWFPSGLAIYYFVSNMWTIGQQHFTNWMLGPLPVHTSRPPAERRVKNVKP